MFYSLSLCNFTKYSASITTNAFLLFFLITTIGSYSPLFDDACSYADHTFNFSTFFASIEYGNFSLAARAMIKSSPPAPIERLSISSGCIFNSSIRSLRNSCCNLLPFAFADCVFIITHHLPHIHPQGEQLHHSEDRNEYQYLLSLLLYMRFRNPHIRGVF